jgi:type IV pilus assembly protein PilA
MRHVTRRAFTLIELMIVVAIIGILAAIAIPNFIKFQARSKQSEVKANLKAAYTSEKAYYQEKDTYSGSVVTIGFQPERGNRYSYCLNGCDATGTLRKTAAKDAPTLATTAFNCDEFKFGATPSCLGGIDQARVVGGNSGTFVLTGNGQVDNDPASDVWTISSESRVSAAYSGTVTLTGCGAGNNPAGEPCVEQSDI